MRCTHARPLDRCAALRSDHISPLFLEFWLGALLLPIHTSLVLSQVLLGVCVHLHAHAWDHFGMPRPRPCSPNGARRA